MLAPFCPLADHSLLQLGFTIRFHNLHGPARVRKCVMPVEPDHWLFHLACCRIGSARDDLASRCCPLHTLMVLFILSTDSAELV